MEEENKLITENKPITEIEYGVDQVEALVALEPIRKRPGMYIGSTSQRGITHLVWEVADNCIDEFMAGYGNEFNIHILSDCTVEIEDYGRGIPVGPHHIWKNEDGTPQDTLIGILTKLHAGGKFNRDDSGYKSSPTTGLHGVGTKCVNALSDYFKVIVKRNGNIYQQEFSKGEPKTKNPIIIGKCDIKDTGTKIIYHPDNEIFKITLEPNCKDLQNRMDELASLNMGLKIHYKNDITNINKTFYYEDGIIGYTKRLVVNSNLLYDNPFYLKGNYTLPNNKIIMVEIAFIHDDDEKLNETIKTFANNINTYEGGFHLQGFRNEYKKQLNKFAIDNKLTDEQIELKYILDGIYAVVSVKVPEAEFEGQTKTKLGNAEAQAAVEETIKLAFEQKIFATKEYKDILQTIVLRAIKVKEAEEAARKARVLARKTGKTTKMSLPGKLADCSNKSGYSELFLCLHGDTKVKLLNGTNLKIEELYNNYKDKSFWIYSVDQDGEFLPALAHKPRITQYVNKLLQIELSDGSIIKCTPEHKFMNRDTMDWVQAKDLNIGSSLYHLSFKDSPKDYELIYSLKKLDYYHTHALVNKIINHQKFVDLPINKQDKTNFPVTHHIDFDKRNNEPTNLRWMLRRRHFKLHYENPIIGIRNIIKYSRSERGRKNSSELMKKYNQSDKHKEDIAKAWANPETRKKMSEGVYQRTEEGIQRQKNAVSKARKEGKYKNAIFATNGYNGSEKHRNDLIKRMNTPESKAKCAKQITESNKNPEHNKKRVMSKIAKVINNCLNASLEFNKENYTIFQKQFNAVPKYENILKYFSSYEEALEFGKNYNFKVVNITELIYENPMPVYCITVDSDSHAFALENGLISHNCEGDSAAGSAKQGRYREFQAVLPLRGKVLNTEKSDLEKLMKSEAITNIIAALGGGVGKDFKIDKVRYDKIIIECDADVDGSHITALLLTLFYNYMKPLIEEGRVFLACPPLYKVIKGKQSIYIKDDHELKEYKKKNSKVDVQRFKGLTHCLALTSFTA